MISRADLEARGDALPRPHAHCYWLLPGRVLAGEHPGGAARVHTIEDAGVTHFIDLTAAHDGIADYAPQRAQHARHAIADFGIPSVEGMRATLDAIDAALDSGGVVYLHCRAGIGRTGTVAACLLVDHGFAPDEALAALAAKWQANAKSAFVSRTPETEAQRAFVLNWKPAQRAR